MESWPIYYKDKLVIGNLSSNVSIVTLWTPVQNISNKIDNSRFCIAGQLYSKRGINFLIRNILANPKIDTIVVCGSNLSGSAEALINFIDHGIDAENNVIGTEKARVDKEIDLESIESFRKNVKIVDLTGEFRAEVVEKSLKEIKSDGVIPWAESKLFADPEKLTAEKFPSEKTTFTIRAGEIKDAWPQILKHIMKFGSKKGMIKVGEVMELVNIVTVIEEEDPYKPEIPDWFNFNHDDLKLYYKGFFSKEAESEDYNYGQRIFSHPLGIPNDTYNSKNNSKKSEDYWSFINSDDLKESKNADNTKFTLNQIEEVFLKLKRYKYDRGAVISIWNPWVDNIAKGWQSDAAVQKSGNVPCMTQLQFCYREHKLQLTAYFRSNDMFDAWPRNAFALRKLQFDLAKKLDVKPGYLTTISSLAQIYEPNFDEAKKIMERSKNATFCRQDQRGNVVVEVEGNEIVMRHMDTSGNETLQEYRISGTQPKAAQKAGDLLTTNLVFSELPHAMDIARELYKAELAIKKNLKFTQDRELEF